MTASLEMVGVLVQGLGRIVGVGLVVLVVTMVFAAFYRWYVRDRVPTRFALILGLGVAAMLLNTASTLGQVIGGGGGSVVQFDAMVANTASLAMGGVASLLGAALGDRWAREMLGWRGVDTGALVRAVGRVITVELPEDIHDIEGYDPVYSDVKESLRGSEHVFPRGLTVEELHDRLVERLKKDYSVGHVDLEINKEGKVEYIAVGSRTAGLGPTMAPDTVAVALQADPAYSAGVGDRVQLWQVGGDGAERVASGELRGANGETVTVAVNRGDVDGLGGDRRRFRLVTVSSERRPEQEFLALLRASDETMGVYDVGGDSELVGVPVGELSVTVVAVGGADGVEAIPRGDRELGAGDTVYAVSRPDELRRFEAQSR